MQHYRVHCGLLSFCICNSSLWSEKRRSCYLFRNSCDQFPHVWPVFQMHTIPTKCPTPSAGRPLPSHLPWSLTPRPFGLRRFALAQPSTPCSWPLGSLPSDFNIPFSFWWETTMKFSWWVSERYNCEAQEIKGENSCKRPKGHLFVCIGPVSLTDNLWVFHALQFLCTNRLLQEQFRQLERTTMQHILAPPLLLYHQRNFISSLGRDLR